MYALQDVNTPARFVLASGEKVGTGKKLSLPMQVIALLRVTGRDVGN